jgi:hypothetical protein
MSTTLTTNVRNGGRLLLAAAVVFVAGYALAVLVEPGDLATELGLAAPLVAAAVLLVIGTATAAAASPVRPLAIGAVVAAVGCALGVGGLVTASMLAELGGLDVEGLYLPLATVTTALGGAAVAALAVALRGVARRTATVLAVLGVIVVLGCLFLDPIVPFVLAGVLGVALARSGASATM